MSSRGPLRIGIWGPPVLVVLVILAIWEIGVRLTATPAWLLPPPSDVISTLVTDRALLAPAFLVTLSEVLLGFLLAVVAGLGLAVLIDASPVLRRAIYPLVVASQTVPIPAIAPLLLVWFGYGLLPKVLVTALIGFFAITVSAVDGFRSADREQLDLLRSMGATPRELFRRVRLPHAAPAIFSGAKIAIAVCVIGAVFGELVGSHAGLGYLLTRALAQFRTDLVMAAIVLLSLMGIGLVWVTSKVEDRVLPWRSLVTATDEDSR